MIARHAFKTIYTCFGGSVNLCTEFWLFNPNAYNRYNALRDIFVNCIIEGRNNNRSMSSGKRTGVSVASIGCDRLYLKNKNITTGWRPPDKIYEGTRHLPNRFQLLLSWPFFHGACNRRQDRYTVFQQGRVNTQGEVNATSNKTWACGTGM